MEWWQITLLVVAVSASTVALASFVLWRQATTRARRLAARVQALSWQDRLSIAAALSFDGRLPPVARLILPALLMYLALPLDLVPDFIPVVGQVDDLLALAIGIGLMRRSIAWQVLELHIGVAERAGPNEYSPLRR